MNIEERMNLATLAALLARHSEKVGARQAACDACALSTLSARAVTNAVNLCNVRDYQETFAKRKAGLQKLADGILEDYPGLRAEFGGDPRGGSCLHIMGLNGNTFGGDQDGFAV